MGRGTLAPVVLKTALDERAKSQRWWVGLAGVGAAAVVAIAAWPKGSPRDQVTAEPPRPPPPTALSQPPPPPPASVMAPPASAAPAEWVRIEPGTFDMGSAADELWRRSDERQHKVTLTHAYWLKATEVTQGEWESVMGSNPSSFKSCGSSCPVENVSFHEVVAYCNALSKKGGLPACYVDGDKDYDAQSAKDKKTPGWPKGLACVGYRLPTEAEWEYAARAGTTTAFYTGAITKKECDEDPNLDRAAWYCGNANHTTLPVKQKASNAWGLYDMLGNVWEWVWDWKADFGAAAQRDPTGPSKGSFRVFRGGAWNVMASFCRVASRLGYEDELRDFNLGFRPARSIP